MIKRTAASHEADARLGEKWLQEIFFALWKAQRFQSREASHPLRRDRIAMLGMV